MDRNKTPLLHISKLNFSYNTDTNPDRWMLCIEDFTMNAREICLVNGDNMSGKSTFLNILAGIQPIGNEPGKISSHGADIQSIEQLQTLSTILSNSDPMFPELSIWDNIRISLSKDGRKAEKMYRQECAAFLKRSDVFSEKSIDDDLGELSTGARALVKFCRACVSESQIMIIDELTSYLDDPRSMFFLDSVIGRIEKGSSALIVSHSARDRAYILEQAIKLNINVQRISILRTGNLSKLGHVIN